MNESKVNWAKWGFTSVSFIGLCVLVGMGTIGGVALAWFFLFVLFFVD